MLQLSGPFLASDARRTLVRLRSRETQRSLGVLDTLRQGQNNTNTQL